MNEPTHLDLFSGIGGFSLAFEHAGFRTIGFAECEPEASLVLAAHWPHVRNWRDAHAFLSRRVRERVGRVDVITGGVPCQPASALGRMRGADDERWIWPLALRLVGKFRPAFAVFENPPSLIGLNGGREWNGIVSGLCARGYDCWWDVFPAAAFGAGHLRERVLLVAADSRYSTASGEPGQTEQALPVGASHASSPRLEGYAGNGSGNGGPEALRPVAPPDLRGRVNGRDWWHEARTGIPVLAHGLPSRLVEAACRCAGNAVVPQAIAPIAETLYRNLTIHDSTKGFA